MNENLNVWLCNSCISLCRKCSWKSNSDLVIRLSEWNTEQFYPVLRLSELAATVRDAVKSKWDLRTGTIRLR